MSRVAHFPEQGLKFDRAEGTRRLYAGDPRGLEALRGWLNGFWDYALNAFKEAAEQAATREKNKS